MKSSTKGIVAGATILALSMVGIGVTKASGLRTVWGSGFHSCLHGAGMRSNLHGEDIADFAMWKLDRHVKELNLTEAQTQEYERVRETIKRSMLEAGQERSEFRRLVRQEMNKESPDMNALVSLIKEKVNHIPEMVSNTADLFLNFFNTLDADQKARVAEVIRWRLGKVE